MRGKGSINNIEAMSYWTRIKVQSFMLESTIPHYSYSYVCYLTLKMHTNLALVSNSKNVRSSTAP